MTTSETHTADCPDCGTRCMTCGDRMCSTNGPAPAPRCPQHPCCERCDDGPVYCGECGLAIAERAQDRAVDVAYDASREAL